MGTYSSFIGQCLAFIGATVLLAFVCPAEARLWVVIMGLLGLGIFVIVSLYRRRSIMRLASEIDDILHTGREVDLTTYREGDIALLSNELAKMVAKLARTSKMLDEERTQLADSLTDISHQIRTPLTAAVLMLPAIERTDDTHERRQAVRKLENMLERISWLVVALMKIAKVDSGAIKVRQQEVDAVSVAKRAIEPLALSLDLKEIELVREFDERAGYIGDTLWSIEALENIIKNCMEHTPRGGTITVSVSEDALATRIRVRDSGSGIAPADLPYIFDRFFRGENSVDEEGQPTSGFGVGLALSKALVTAQGGTIRAKNAPGGGALFEIVFQKAIV